MGLCLGWNGRRLEFDSICCGSCLVRVKATNSPTDDSRQFVYLDSLARGQHWPDAVVVSPLD